MSLAAAPTYPPAPSGDAPTLGETGIAMVWTLAVPALAAVAFLGVAKAAGWPGTAIPWVLPAAAVPGGIGLWWWLVRRRGWGRRELGFTRPTRSLWHLLWEAPLAIAGSALVAATLGSLLGIAPASQAASSVSHGGAGAPLAVSLLLAAAVVLPAMEEISFRGLLFGWLAARTSTWAAVLLTGVTFGLVHVAPAIICYVLPLGIALTALRVWHGSLWASLLVHAANNTLVTVLLLMALR